MRISDLSSDVCSSDLEGVGRVIGSVRTVLQPPPEQFEMREGLADGFRETGIARDQRAVVVEERDDIAFAERQGLVEAFEIAWLDRRHGNAAEAPVRLLDAAAQDRKSTRLNSSH